MRHDHYSPDGTLAGYTIVTREIEFDEDEQAGVLAYEELLDNQCPGCGGQIDETTDPDVHWHAPPPTRCFKCDARLTAQTPFFEINQDTGKPLTPNVQALLWQVDRV